MEAVGAARASPRWAPTSGSVAWRNSTSILLAANAVADSLNVPPPWLTRGDQLQVPALLPRPKAPVGEVYLARYLSESAADPRDPSAPDNPLAQEAGALTRIIEQEYAAAEVRPKATASTATFVYRFVLPASTSGTAPNWNV